MCTNSKLARPVTESLALSSPASAYGLAVPSHFHSIATPPGLPKNVTIAPSFHTTAHFQNNKMLDPKACRGV